ncbi:MAG TPA: DNA ligase D, partial [Isosphaeraceae bacterium]|nr:DNA ligase D [Isosphaeraceae bacterium]
RAIAEVDARDVHLYSRNQVSFDAKFPALRTALAELGHAVVLDGEVVVVDDTGNARFQLLQTYQKTGEGQLLYLVFDLLFLDGHDLRSLPLVRRKEILTEVLKSNANHLVRLSEHVEDRGVDFFDAARAHHLEGIVAKNGRSVYREGVRGPDWLKIKTHLRQEALICGFTEPRRSRKHVGALILGVFDGDNLVYIGHTGGGFNGKQLADLLAKLKPLVRPTCPFQEPPKTNSAVHWVEPSLVCEVSFQEWTSSGVMRQPIFVGFREDKPANQVHRETPRPTSNMLKSPGRDKGRESAVSRSNGKHRPSGGHRVELTHLDKVYWPEEGFTKGDLIAYYRDMAPLILPYLRDRPESLHRHPEGISATGFFQKDVSLHRPPSWVRTVKIPSETKGTIEYVVCQDEDSLLYLVNLGCIELNPWSSRVGSLDEPDYLIIDLDPEAIPFSRVIEAAQAVRRVLDKAGASSVCKTSGKSGLHILVPLKAGYSYEHAKQFAELIANVVHQSLPRSTSVVRSPAKRQRRVYLDFLQNRRGQTIAAPYCVRPVHGASVSTPLQWREVKAGLDPANFTMSTIRKRTEKLGDLWKPVLEEGIDLEECLSRLMRRTRRSGSS